MEHAYAQSQGTEVRFHTKLNNFLSTGRVLGSLRVKAREKMVTLYQQLWSGETGHSPRPGSGTGGECWVCPSCSPSDHVASVAGLPPHNVASVDQPCFLPPRCHTALL